MDKLFYYIVVLFTTIGTALALECYVCDDQEHNRFNSKCRKDRQRCEQFQDACVSYVRWAVQDVWSPRGERRYYISKGCDTRQGCYRRQAQTSSVCQRDYYNDWACVECCVGDLCNYYVTEGSSSIQGSIFTAVCSLATILLLRQLT